MIADYEGDVTNLFNVNIDGELPILATRNIAIFPGVISPVIIGRKQSLNLLDKLRHLPYSARKTRKWRIRKARTFSNMAFMPSS